MNDQIQCLMDVTINTVPDSCASAKVAFLHPLGMQFRGGLYVPGDGPLSGEYILTTFVLSVFNLTGEIFTFENLNPILIHLQEILTILADLLKVLYELYFL